MSIDGLHGHAFQNRCQFKIEDRELLSSIKRLHVAHARAALTYVATRDLSNCVSKEALRLHMGRFAVS